MLMPSSCLPRVKCVCVSGSLCLSLLSPRRCFSFQILHPNIRNPKPLNPKSVVVEACFGLVFCSHGFSVPLAHYRQFPGVHRKKGFDALRTWSA